MTESATDQQRRRLTIPGQASWGVGPETCRECSYWKGGNRYQHGGLKKAPCQKAQMMLPGLPNIPHWAPCCRFFERSVSAPAVYPR
jgi:hypothetical protein